MLWGKRRLTELCGSVLFPGAIPPRPENFDFGSLTVERRPDSREKYWHIHVSGPDAIDADIVCLRNAPLPPAILIDQDIRLSPSERAAARQGRTGVGITLRCPGQNPLRERKRLLELMHGLMAHAGAVAIDHVAQAMWSKASLEEECAHKADLDILALFTVHAVGEEGQDPAPWMHTHGLQELGFTDFDILNPAPGIERAWDTLRTVAFSIVEGDLRAGGPALSLVRGAPRVRLVPSGTLRATTRGRHRDWEALLDEDHIKGRAVLCNAGGGLFSFLSPKPKPWSLLSDPLPDDMPIRFSDAASDLMAARARETVPLLLAIRKELADLPFPCLVKLRYDGPRGSEHLWFEVHAADAHEIDATLTNEPFQDLGIHNGDRRKHPLDRLSDWIFMTPAGLITPRGLTPLRTIREHRPEIEEAVRKANHEGP